ncbi:MAG: Gfo/Idh/MocA family oxidoreductase [Methylovulum sp.]|jgi:predicted dehydrogenase|nr:Gfo/Idh/MocA family oxidoreductase [Methylovulum sp.]MCF7999129.1 Gfo/Idh/MocA family oxidoreductase [Methylovulum sp.]
MTHQTQLRWGILGAARINERLMPAIADAQNAQLLGIASRRQGAAAETLARYAQQLSNISTYDRLEDLLVDPRIDAVYLPLANHEHAEWTLRAIEHGKHVLCEKPMALDTHSIETIIEAAKHHQVTVMEGFMYRFHPQHARVRELLDSGLIGDIQSVRASFSFMMRPARMYRLQEPITNGGGALWDIGCYAVHAIRQFFQQPAVAVTALSHYAESGADIASSGVIDFGAGKFAQFDFSFARARRCEYEIIGTQGGITCHTVWQLPGDVPMISWWTEDGRHAQERLPASNHFRLEIEHFSDCVLQGKSPQLSLDDAKQNCELLVAIWQSAAQGCRILL